MDLFHRYRKQCNIQLHARSGHRTVPDKENANTLAKQGSFKLFMPQNLSSLNCNVLNWIEIQHRLYLNWAPELNHNLILPSLAKILELSRNRNRTVTGLLIGRQCNLRNIYILLYHQGILQLIKQTKILYTLYWNIPQ